MNNAKANQTNNRLASLSRPYHLHFALWMKSFIFLWILLCFVPQSMACKRRDGRSWQATFLFTSVCLTWCLSRDFPRRSLCLWE